MPRWTEPRALREKALSGYRRLLKALGAPSSKSQISNLKSKISLPGHDDMPTWPKPQPLMFMGHTVARDGKPLYHLIPGAPAMTILWRHEPGDRHWVGRLPACLACNRVVTLN